MYKVRRVVVGGDSRGELGVTSDELMSSTYMGFAGESVPLWTVGPGQTRLDDDGTARVADQTISWSHIMVPPDAERPVRSASDRAGVLHEHDSVDLISVVSGEVWLELDGVEEWVHLRAGETMVQRGTKHAWHNLTHEPAYLSTIWLKAERTAQTPSRKTADDVIFERNPVAES